MAWPDEILSGLPSPRDDEPASLRRDIEDELADHLHCAMQRERTTTDDEQAARRTVLARFGNPRRVAYKLWFDAMKEKIMKDRLMIAASILMMLTCAVAIGAMWLTLKESREVNTALLAQIKNMAAPLAQPAIPADAAFFEIKAVQGNPNGKPLAGGHFILQGNAFEPSQSQDLYLITDKDGSARVGPIRPGQYNLRCDAVWSNQFGTKPVTLFGGQTHEKTIVCPPDVNVQPVSARIQVEWFPEILKCFDVAHLPPKELFLLGGELQSDPDTMNLPEMNYSVKTTAAPATIPGPNASVLTMAIWTRPPLSFVVDREGLFACVNAGLKDNGGLTLGSRDELQATNRLYPGRYRLKSLFIYSGVLQTYNRQASLNPNFFYKLKKDEEPVIELGADGILKIVPPPAFLKALQDVYGMEKTITLQKGETQQFRDLNITLQSSSEMNADLAVAPIFANAAITYSMKTGQTTTILNIEFKVERADKEAGDRGSVTLHLRYIPAGEKPAASASSAAGPSPTPIPRGQILYEGSTATSPAQSRAPNPQPRSKP